MINQNQLILLFFDNRGDTPWGIQGERVQFYKHFHYIMRIFNVLKNSAFTTSETICDYYL